MEHLIMAINQSWWWLGRLLVIGLAILLGYVMWDLIRQEVRWWRKKRDWERFINE